MNRRPLPPHGTWQRYSNKNHPCRCQPCRDARRRYGKALEVANHRRTRTINNTIDATPSRERLTALRAAGVPTIAICNATGVSRAAINRILNGDTTHVTRNVAARIDNARINPDHLPGHRLIPEYGVRRRLQALHADGWSWQDIADILGQTRGNIAALGNGTNRTRVQTSTHHAIDDLWRRLGGRGPTPRDARHAMYIERAKNRARQRGWATSWAWDEDTIDDAAAEPEWDALPYIRPHQAA